MKHIQKILALILITVLINACVKSKDFNEDNTIPTGAGSRPVSSNAFVDLALPRTVLENKAFSIGASFTTELQFFSESPVKEINFYATRNKAGTKTKVTTFPYAKAFSVAKGLDTLLIPYTIPAIFPSTVPVPVVPGDTLKLDFEIVNQNSLSLTRTVSVRVK